MGSLRPWDHARAALILVALVVNGVAASPLPKSVKRSQFDTPIAKEELARWVGILGTVGIDITHAELADRSYAIGKGFADVRKVLMGPFGGWFRVTGTGQGWGLFTYPDSYPHQLVIEVKERGKWRTVYAGLDDDAAWRRATLAYRRVRGVYDGNTRKPGASYDNFVKWIGAEALADFPAASEVRVGFVRLHSTAPGEPKDPERTAKFQRTVKR